LSNHRFIVVSSKGHEPSLNMPYSDDEI